MAFTTVVGSSANDATTLTGTAGQDIIAIAAGTSKLNVKALDGVDVVDARNATLTGSFLNGNQGNDELRFLTIASSTALGGQGVDYLEASDVQSSRINGNKGADGLLISGSAGGSINGGQGTDTLDLTGAFVATRALGDNGNDTILVRAGSNLDNTIVNGNAANDTITVQNIASFTNSSNIRGGAGNDVVTAAASATAGVTLNGDAGTDTLTGGAQADTLLGGSENDSLIGGAQTDTLNGGSGSDTLTGGTGIDALTGGAAADTFNADSAAAANRSTIADFTLAQTDVFNIDTSVGTLSGTRFAAANSIQDYANPGQAGAITLAGNTSIFVADGLNLGAAATAANSLTGANLLTAVTAGNANAVNGGGANTRVLFAIDDNAGNAVIYYGDSGNNAGFAAGEITQIAVLTGVAATNLTIANLSNVAI